MNAVALAWRSRIWRGVAALLLLGLLLVARALEPDPRGWGTHQQLGLGACAWRSLVGIRCPACGATTAFAHVVRGELRQAVHANLGGTLVAIGSAAVASLLAVEALRGQPWPLLLWPQVLLTAAATIAVVALLEWFVRVAGQWSSGGFG